MKPEIINRYFRVIVFIIACLNNNKTSAGNFISEISEKFSQQYLRNTTFEKNGLYTNADYIFNVSANGMPDENNTSFLFYYSVLDVSEIGSLSFSENIPIALNVQGRQLLNEKLQSKNQQLPGNARIYVMVFDALFIRSYFNENLDEKVIMPLMTTAYNQPNLIPMKIDDSHFSSSDPMPVINSTDEKRVKYFGQRLSEVRTILRNYINLVVSAISEQHPNIFICHSLLITTRLGEETKKFSLYRMSGFTLAREAYAANTQLKIDKENKLNSFLWEYISGSNDVSITTYGRSYSLTNYQIDLVYWDWLLNELNAWNQACSQDGENAENILKLLWCVPEELIADLNVDLRLCIVRKILSAQGALSYNLDFGCEGSTSLHDAEKAFLRLIEFLPNEQIVYFFDQMEETRIGNRSMFKEMIEQIDGDEYDHLMTILLKKFNIYFQNKSYTALNDIHNRIIRFSLQRHCNEIGDHVYNKAELTDNNYIDYEYKIVSGCNKTTSVSGLGATQYESFTNVYETSYTGLLHAYSPVILYDDSRLPLVANTLNQTATGKFAIVPAFFLQYIKHKESQQTINEIINRVAVVVDVATLITGPGIFWKAFRAGKSLLAVYEASQIIAAGLNTGANITGDQHHPLIVNFNIVVGAWGVLRLGGAIGKIEWNRIGNYIDPLSDNPVRTLSQAEIDSYLHAYENSLDFLQTLSEEERIVHGNLYRYLRGSVSIIDETIELVRGVSKSDFISSVREFSENPLLANQAWSLFKNERWSELENLINSHSINGGWPPNNGFVSIEARTLKVGHIIDRYGGRYIDGVFKDNGRFVSPLGVPFEARALPDNVKMGPYKKYEILKEFNVNEGVAIPWFNQPGRGIQYHLQFSIEELIQNGYIKEIL